MKSARSLTLIVCLAGSAFPVTAQEQAAAPSSFKAPATTTLAHAADIPKIEVAAGYSFMRDLDVNRSFQQGSGQRSWAGRHPVLLGALVGAGIGVGFGVIHCDLADQKGDFPCKSVFGTQGAIFGAFVGLIRR